MTENNTITTLPDDVLIIVPTRDTVLFPGAVTPVVLGRKASINGVQEAVRSERDIGFVLQRDPAMENPSKADLFSVGTSASVLRYVTAKDSSHHVIASGGRRFHIIDFIGGFEFMVARVDYIDERSDDSVEVQARALYLRQRAEEALQLISGGRGAELAAALYDIKEPGMLADTVAGFMDIEPEDKQRVLETFDIPTRLNLVIDALTRRLDVLRLTKDIDDQTRSRIDSNAREHMLREQLNTIRKELGDDAAQDSAIHDLTEAMTAAELPADVEQEVRRELGRLERMGEQSAEYAGLRTWVETVIDLPWAKLDEESIDIEAARTVLDEDHHGLDKVKRRILEFLAVRKLNPHGKSPILCLAGPPGVGKTSLGKSIARALGVKFARVSLGGVHDEAEVRGHRRTYIGALPGTILRSLRKAGTRNPVFMLDEIDKLGASVHGDPSSALLEVLDPEQNNTFSDNYLGVPFDLSRVLFIATANMLDTIPAPLRDRMEVIEIPGYTAEEKLTIAQRYLVERQRKENGLQDTDVEIDAAALELVIRSYTHEAGVRGLERQVGALMRHAAMRVAAGKGPVKVDAATVGDVLGGPQHEPELAMRQGVPGVSTGLAWTPMGGDILFIEATRAPGKGNLILTGQLGDVMRESAQAALSRVKSQAANLGIDTNFDDSEIHIHVPAGAIPKDGPSAGVALYIALVSLLTNRPVRHDLAMTGEISLRGLVMPVGGIKEKCLAALRAGIRTVMLPARNRKDLADIPEAARDRLEFVWLENLEQASEHAFGHSDHAGDANKVALSGH